jgi:hypothetical protein
VGVGRGWCWMRRWGKGGSCRRRGFRYKVEGEEMMPQIVRKTSVAFVKRVNTCYSGWRRGMHIYQVTYQEDIKYLYRDVNCSTGMVSPRP